MTAVQLCKFVNDNNIEWHLAERSGKEDVIAFISIYEIRDFNKLLSSGILDEEGLTCIMKDGYFCFWMNDICEYFGFDFKEVFTDEQK